MYGYMDRNKFVDNLGCLHGPYCQFVHPVEGYGLKVFIIGVTLF